MTTGKNVRGRLVIIQQEEELKLKRTRHLLHLMIPQWKASGIEVTEIFGTDNAPDGDVAFLHVDLSVVPPEYLALAKKYPVTINGNVPDIRKSELSRLRLQPGSGYEGHVIVKTNLNHAGEPEKDIQRCADSFLQKSLRRFARTVFRSRFSGRQVYSIYPSAIAVPASIWASNDYIVEKFKPETHDGLYCLREWYFCGNQDFQRVELSKSPVFTYGNLVEHLDLPVPEELRVLREQLGFDYGKFDYTVVDGKAVPFDFNKTIGVLSPEKEVIQKCARQLARGLDFYFK